MLVETFNFLNVTSSFLADHFEDSTLPFPSILTIIFNVIEYLLSTIWAIILEAALYKNRKYHYCCWYHYYSQTFQPLLRGNREYILFNLCLSHLQTKKLYRKVCYMTFYSQIAKDTYKRSNFFFVIRIL